MPPTTRPRRSRAQTKPTAQIVKAIAPILPAVMEPIVQPVVERLDRHEELLLQVKTALDVQFQRIAAMQAQLDRLLAQRSRP